jgi:hypothetical protein
LVIFNDSLVLLAQSLDTVDNLGGCSSSKALNEGLVLVSDDTALTSIRTDTVRNTISTYSFLDNIHCVLNNRVGSILGVADDDLLAVGGSVGQGHEECDQKEVNGELHVD